MMLHAGCAETKGKRKKMEDRHVIAEHLPTFSEFSLFGVFDGHGGSKAAETLKELIIPTVETHIHREKLRINNAETRVDALKQVLHNSFMEVDTLFSSLFPNQRDGSTALVALVYNTSDNAAILAVANAGDCRALLYSEGNKTLELSHDHKPNRHDKKTRIEELGGAVLRDGKFGVWRVQGSLAVSRSIGDFPLKRFVIPDPEISITFLSPADVFFLMASDGVWDVMGSAECAEHVASQLNATNHDPEELATEVVKMAMTKGSTDNATCIVVKLAWDVGTGHL